MKEVVIYLTFSCVHCTCWSSKCCTLSLFSKIVLVAVQDSAETYGLAAISALKRLGAREPIILEFRSSLALAGFAGSTVPSWVSLAQNKRYQGPSVLMVTIGGGTHLLVTYYFFKKVSFLLFEGCCILLILIVLWAPRNHSRPQTRFSLTAS